MWRKHLFFCSPILLIIKEIVKLAEFFIRDMNIKCDITYQMFEVVFIYSGYWRFWELSKSNEQFPLASNRPETHRGNVTLPISLRITSVPALTLFSIKLHNSPAHWSQILKSDRMKSNFFFFPWEIPWTSFGRSHWEPPGLPKQVHNQRFPFIIILNTTITVNGANLTSCSR